MCDGDVVNEWLALGIAVGTCFAAAAIGSWATVAGLREWYPLLRKPSWNPPNAVFGPVWTILYLAMAVAVWLVWRSGGDVAIALWLFASQLVLNVAWSVVFFGRRQLRGALAVIVGLWIAIVATLVVFASIDVVAAALLVPYLAWVTFASFLNGAIARLNPAY
jgi:tryptophan-rich sensory protein